VHGHFNKVDYNGRMHGVYLVKQLRSGNIVYIGKSGTMRQDGTYKNQDLERRLTNKEKGERRNSICGQRVEKYGELLIEYIILDTTVLVPGYVEAMLLQAYYDERRCLPPDNDGF
jgi:hypothetical protein